MKRFITSSCLFAGIAIVSLAQKPDGKITDTCNCLREALKKTDKLEFNRANDGCFRTLLRVLLEDMAKDEANEELGRIMTKVLRKDCDIYQKHLDAEKAFGAKRVASKIRNPAVCQIFRTGEFHEPTSSDNVVVTMRDSIQIVTFEDTHVYSKSKVTWLDDCTYRLTFMETTNPYEKMLMEQNFVRTVRIIDVNDNLVVVEIKINNGYVLAELIKQ
jgi:superfamily II RNA helicase